MLDVAKPAIPFDTKRLDRLMDDAGIDVLIANSKHNIQYLLGGHRSIFFDYMDAMGTSRYLPLLVYPKGAPEKAAFFQRTPTWCREQASQLGEHVRAAVDELLDQHHLHYLRQSQGIIRLAEKYGEVRLDAACQRALAYGNPHYRTIKTILEKGLEPNVTQPTPPAIASVGAYLHGPEALFGLTSPRHQEIPA